MTAMLGCSKTAAGSRWRERTITRTVCPKASDCSTKGRPVFPVAPAIKRASWLSSHSEWVVSTFIDTITNDISILILMLGVHIRMEWRAMNFDWNRARAFLVTAEEGSFRRSTRLSSTQPTVGRQVAALEQELGVRLERIAHGWS